MERTTVTDSHVFLYANPITSNDLREPESCFIFMKILKPILLFLVLFLSGNIAKAGGSYTLKVGEQKMLSFNPKEGAMFNTMSWRSYDTSCVQVDGPQYSSYTYITALAPTTSSRGALVQCEYKYMWNGLALTATEDFYITVENNTPSEPTGISIQKSLTINVGESYTLVPTFYPSGTSSNVSWSTSNASVASVSGSGRVHGVSEGNATIYATTSNGYSASCFVTVVKPKVQLSISNTKTLIPKGTKVALKASPSTATIYYTVDGTTPSSTSTLYTDSIEIDKDLTLKAIGIKDGYRDSEVLMQEYRCSGLSMVSAYPSSEDDFLRASIVPTITFNDSITPIDISEIKLTQKNTDVAGKILIYGKYISFVPEKELSAGDYIFKIPEGCVQSSLGRNMLISQQFTIKEDVKISKISTGYYHTMAVKSDGTLWTWGANFCGQLADGTVSQYRERSPQKVMDNVIDAVGGYGHTLILKNDKTLWSVGRNEFGQLGRGYTSLTGGLGKVMSNVSIITTHGDCCYALKDDGSVYYWGAYAEYGYDKHKSSPTLLTTSAKYISAGFGLHLLIIKEDGSLWGWYDNSHGQLGDTGQTAHYTPIKIMDDVLYCAAGAQTSYAIRSDNSLWAWGSNTQGQIGDGTKISKKEPTKIMDDVKVVSSTSNVAVAVKSDGSLWQWGRGKLIPEKIMDDVIYAVPEYFAIKNGGTLFGWGDNSDGQIGVGSYKDNIEEPTLIFKESEKICPSSVSIQDSEAIVGYQMVLSPQIGPNNASYRNIQWMSDNESVLTIDSFGCVTANEIGKAKITVIVTDYNGNELRASCIINVIKLVSSIYISPDSIELKIGEKKSITAYALPSDASNPTLRWYSEDESIANVKDGLVTAVGKGTTNVVAESTDGSGISAKCKVKSIDFSDVESISSDHVNVFVANGTVNFINVPVNETVNIYLPNGTLIKKLYSTGDVIRFQPVPSSLYFIVIGQRTFKVFIP